MILDRQECELFFSLFDSLTDYANGKWGVAPAVINQQSGYVNEANQQKVAAEVWRKPGICEELANECHHLGVSAEDAEILRSWSHAYTDSFIVRQDESGVTYFLTDDVAFEVCGLSREIISVLNMMPTIVNATLLPFKGKVVYAVYLEERPVIFGMGMQKIMDERWNTISQSGKIIRSADEFLEAIPWLEEQRISREAERMLNSLEADLNEDEVGQGAHRGVLAGLSAEQREREVQAHVCEYQSAQAAIAGLSPYCLAAEPVTSLRGQLLLLYKDELQQYAKMLGLSRISKLNKNQLVDAILPVVLAPDFVQALVEGIYFEEYEQVKKLYAAGSYLEVPASEIHANKDFYPEIDFLCFPYLVDDTFVFLIPEEMRDALALVDWKQADAAQKENELLVSMANFEVEIRGICNFDEFYQEYFLASENPCSYGEALGRLSFIPRGDMILYSIWMDEEPGKTYLVHADLTAAFGGCEDASCSQRLQMGKLPLEIQDLISVREQHKPRRLTEEMLSLGDYVKWAQSRPAAVALRDWLDAHVPDEADDYTYGDILLDQFIIMCTQEFPMQVIFDHVSKALVLADETQLDKLMNLFTNLTNALPKWSNNGWTPNELHDSVISGAFYNEDGSVKRVGPFDKCPCGSGKLYKDCHGE